MKSCSWNGHRKSSDARLGRTTPLRACLCIASSSVDPTRLDARSRAFFHSVRLYTALAFASATRRCFYWGRFLLFLPRHGHSPANRSTLFLREDKDRSRRRGCGNDENQEKRGGSQMLCCGRPRE